MRNYRLDSPKIIVVAFCKTGDLVALLWMFVGNSMAVQAPLICNAYKEDLSEMRLISLDDELLFPRALELGLQNDFALLAHLGLVASKAGEIIVSKGTFDDHQVSWPNLSVGVIELFQPIDWERR